MAQRARNHATSVYAFKADDAIWQLWKNESKAGTLTLPCCGGTAVPRTHPLSGTRFFSHAPYAARTCEWKATGALHEDLVNQACAILVKLGWQIETDCWMEKVPIDILATHPTNGDQVAVMMETATKADRPDEKLIWENEALHHTNLRSVLWFLPTTRIGALEDALLSLPYQKTSEYSENTIRMVADLLHEWFERIDEIVPMQISADNSRTRMRDIHEPYGIKHGGNRQARIEPADPTQVDQDPEWHDGKGSVGSPQVRSERLVRLAHRWMDDGKADRWLKTEIPELGDTPIGAAQCSVHGYLQAQDALKAASLTGEAQIKLL